ncbi:MAG: energy transducer TonB [Bacteroidetes bacterium]|nr:MAG: energy transducer TonB [Bacteroidota bacterium]RLD48246.1 MAG: energy transducer TonB [Bacteroidota bacterium]RLD72875.1 MAG: energy transducer TonB [Bacteroidota bacterium]RLD87346.1 MAG: energy transducer TonB [Bacteroidota bacterium]HHL57920.1 energy transducer TonB [Bacteroidota bacterium]
MEAKKTPKADLENKKTLFFEIGLILALVVVLAAFEYKSYDKITIDLAQRVADDVTEEIIPITEQKIKPPPPPPPKQVTQIKIVEDDVEVEDDLDIDVEADDETVVEEYIPPVEDEEEVSEAEIFTVVESMPSFPGGMGALMKYLAENIKYPPLAKESGIQGRVFINFVVEPDGSISNVKVLRGIGGGCDEEAVRVVERMPKWSPGKQRGKPVRVSYNLPVKFTLQ